MPSLIRQKWKRLETHGRRTRFQVSNSVSDMHQSNVSIFVLKMLDDDCFAIITTGGLFFIKSSIRTCIALNTIITIICQCCDAAVCVTGRASGL